MKYLFEPRPGETGPISLTVGNFDGLHLGHRALIDTAYAKARSKNIQSALLSFYPHTRAQNGCGQMILTKSEKMWLLEEMGLDYFIEWPFGNGFSELSPEDFVNEILVRRLNVKCLVVGHDFRFGKARAGDSDKLRFLCDKAGIELDVVSPKLWHGEKISSTMIRSQIAECRLMEAAQALGRPYFIKGSVTQGKQLGRTLGFPTANLIPEKDKLLPPMGVYATELTTNGKSYMAVTNVGNNPTVAGEITTVESFVLDFQGDLYNREITVSFIGFVREQRRFGDLSLLKAQIDNDVHSVRKFFNKNV